MTHALEALRPLQEADAPGLARLVIRHTRKSGGDLVDAGRGSSAFAGEADVLVSMTRPKGMRPSVRRLDAIGRFEAIPPHLTIERVIWDCSIPATGSDPVLPESNETYQVVDSGEATDPDSAPASTRVAKVLPNTPEGALSVSELAEAMGESPRSVRHGLDQLANQTCRLGSGKRTDPYRFFITATPDLKGLHEWNKQKGGTAMAIRGTDRAPPDTRKRVVHDDAGDETPGATNNPVTE